MTWTLGSFELPPASIKSLLNLGKLGPTDAFVDLGCGTGKVVIMAAQLFKVKRSVGVEVEYKSREKARLDAIESLDREALARVDFWLGTFTPMISATTTSRSPTTASKRTRKRSRFIGTGSQGEGSGS